jgi:hypothetical protein
VANSTVRPLAAKRRIEAQKPCRLSTSIPTVGSSSRSSSGFPARAKAKRTRCVCPPESLSERRPAMSVSSAVARISLVGNGSRYSARASSMCSRTGRSPRGPTPQHRADCQRDRPRWRGAEDPMFPWSAGVGPSSMLMVVDFPAPFGPSSATVRRA